MATTYWEPYDFGTATNSSVRHRHSPDAAGSGPPAARLLVSYVVLLPLMIFAVHGAFSFERVARNSQLVAYGGEIAVPTTPSESAQESLQSWVALLLCLAPMLPHCRGVLHTSLRMPLMIVLPLLAAVSAFWSQSAGRSLHGSILLLGMTLFAFYLVNRFSPRQQMELILLTGAFVVVSSVALAILRPQFGVDHQLHPGAWQGLFSQKNVCAQATLFLLSPALALPINNRGGQMLRCMYILLCLLVIGMSQSRSGWAMTALYLGFAFSLKVTRRFRRRDLMPLAGGLVVTVIAASLSIAHFLPSAATIITQSDALSGRLQIWHAILISILREPIGGYGFDAFWSLPYAEASRVFAATGWVVTGAHNGFLNVGLELGVMGFTLVLLTLLQAFRHTRTAFLTAGSSYVDWCIGLVFLTVVYNLDERTLLATQYLPWILYVLACTGLRDAAHGPETAAIAAPAVEECA